jgi:hypothetical protein
MQRILAAVGARVGGQPSRELLLGQHRSSGAHVVEQLRHVGDAERADGAISQAPRHSKPRTLTSASSPAVAAAASRSASYSSSAPHSEQEMFVHTYTLWRGTGVVSSMS